MRVAEAQIAAVYDELCETYDTSGCWADSSVMEGLLLGVRSLDALPGLDVFQLLDQEDRDLVLVSVELRRGVFAHTAPMRWRELGPTPGTVGVGAVREVLLRLDGIVDQMRAAHAHGAST